MRTTGILKHLAWGVMILATARVSGQASVLGNAGVPTDYLGWSNTNNFALPIRHNANQPIDFYTRAIHRMRLTPYVSTAMGPLNEFPAVDREGFLLLSPSVANFYASGANGPFSRMHLHDGTTAVLQPPYRPWMDNGITFTTNSDQMYIGHKVEPGFGQTAAVIQKQRLRRPRSVAGIYTALDRGSTTDAHC